MAVTYESGTITLDKPPANSYDIDYMRELGAAIEAASADAAVRVVVVRSAVFPTGTSTCPSTKTSR